MTTHKAPNPGVQQLSILRTLQALGACTASCIALHTGLRESSVKKCLQILIARADIAHQHEPTTVEPCMYDLTPAGYDTLEQHANANDVWSTPRPARPMVASVWELGCATTSHHHLQGI